MSNFGVASGDNQLEVVEDDTLIRHSSFGFRHSHRLRHLLKQSFVENQIDEGGSSWGDSPNFIGSTELV